MTYLEIVKSSRFQQLVVVAGLLFAVSAGYIPEGDLSTLANSLIALLLGSVGIGTVDRFGEKVGKK